MSCTKCFVCLAYKSMAGSALILTYTNTIVVTPLKMYFKKTEGHSEVQLTRLRGKYPEIYVYISGYECSSI
jgi:hypothetical protein